MKIEGKWNGKVYGKKGSYNIYVNNEKRMLSDSDAEEILNAQKKENEIQESKKGAIQYAKQIISCLSEKKPLTGKDWATAKREAVTLQEVREELIAADGDDDESYNAILSDEDIQNLLKK